MPREHFSVEGATSFESVSPGGNIHIIGVAGVAMAQLAVALVDKGYKVSGSDKQFYEPTGSLLRSSAVTLHEGYKPEHVPQNVDLVVIANAPFYENEEVREVERRNLPYTSFPQLLGEFLIGDRHSVVCAGTHGKSTTSAMCAYLLREAGKDPSWFVGGVAQSLPSSFHVGEGDFSAVEGDEYHSAFYARVPKFKFFRAKTCLLNAIEFDHADIYPTLDDVVREFHDLLLSLPEDGNAICSADYEAIRKLLSDVPVKARVCTFGTHESANYRIVGREQNGFTQTVKVESEGGAFSFQLPLVGEYNAKNALGALLVMQQTGGNLNAAIGHISRYQGVKRRQEIRFDRGGIVLIEDFAHHPTAVKGTVEAVREAYPSKKIWAVFEPRSNTSRRKVFQDPYISAFQKADQVVLCEVGGTSIQNKGAELLDVGELSDAIAVDGRPSTHLPDAAAIQRYLLDGIGQNDVILLMSNGAFGGLPASLTEALQARSL